MEPLNPETEALRGAFRLMLKDLNALPADAYDRSFGPKVRTVADIVYEVNLVNDHLGMGIREEPQFDWPEGWPKAPEGLRTKEDVIVSFLQSSEKLVDTFARFTPEEMLVKTTTERGETDRAERCRFATLHAWYHLGQLNYVQTLLGDDEWHWLR